MIIVMPTIDSALRKGADVRCWRSVADEVLV
jgi:hypothetical protein